MVPFCQLALEVSRSLDTLFIHVTLPHRVPSFFCQFFDSARVLYFVSFWCSFRSARSVILSEVEEGTVDTCSAMASFVKHAERRVPVIESSLSLCHRFPFLLSGRRACMHILRLLSTSLWMSTAHNICFSRTCRGGNDLALLCFTRPFLFLFEI